MIAGPILPRTTEGLWSVVQDDAGRVEHGLVVIRRDLVLDGGLTIDALAADAAGRPVLLFLSLVEDDHALPARIAEARAWFARSAAMLREVVDGFRIRLDLPPRVIAIGFEFTERCLARLSSDDDELMLVRVDAVRVAGRVHVGTVVVRGAETGAWTDRLAARDDVARVNRFVDLMQRLDDRMSIEGDRFARTWRCDGMPIASLHRETRAVHASVPGHATVALCSDEAVEDAVDLATRRYLGVLLGSDDSPIAFVEPEQGPVTTREVVDAAEVTADEYEAFFADDGGVK
ncbi:MAG: hypothetical protein U1F36_13265 [Planctomycetota bacterium]